MMTYISPQSFSLLQLLTALSWQASCVYTTLTHNGTHPITTEHHAATKVSSRTVYRPSSFRVNATQTFVKYMPIQHVWESEFQVDAPQTVRIPDDVVSSSQTDSFVEQPPIITPAVFPPSTPPDISAIPSLPQPDAAPQRFEGAPAEPTPAEGNPLSNAYHSPNRPSPQQPRLITLPDSSIVVALPNAGHSIIINSHTVVAATDASGSTFAVIDGTTSTLAPSVQGQQPPISNVPNPTQSRPSSSGTVITLPGQPDRLVTLPPQGAATVVDGSRTLAVSTNSRGSPVVFVNNTPLVTLPPQVPSSIQVAATRASQLEEESVITLSQFPSVPITLPPPGSTTVIRDSLTIAVATDVAGSRVVVVDGVPRTTLPASSPNTTRSGGTLSSRVVAPNTSAANQQGSPTARSSGEGSIRNAAPAATFTGAACRIRRDNYADSVLSAYLGTLFLALLAHL